MGEFLNIDIVALDLLRMINEKSIAEKIFDEIQTKALITLKSVVFSN